MLKFVSRGDAGSSASTSADPEQSASASTDPQLSSASTSKDPGKVQAGSVSTSTTRDVQPASHTSSDSNRTVAAPPNDPADWPPVLTDFVRAEFVRRGPFKPGLDFSYPKDKSRRVFHSDLLQRQLSNGEKVPRSWLSYSVKNNAVYCFCCKLFSTKDYKIIKEGVNDWSNINVILGHHEGSPEHTNNMLKWRELDLCLSRGQTLDQIQMTILEAERKRWRDVLTRLISITQSLAERNLAFRGSSDKLFQPDNRNFLKEVELLAKFDPVMETHLSKIKDGETHAHYLG